MFEMILAFAILAAALVIFMLDIVAIDFVALTIMALILALGPVLGVAPHEAISGFSNPATITILAMFILSAGVYRTGIINRLAHQMIRFSGDSMTKQLLIIGLVVGPISAFINNTAAVAILIPSVITMARKHHRAPSKLLIPLSYFSQIAGTTTLIGTATNILTNSLFVKSAGAVDAHGVDTGEAAAEIAGAAVEPFGMFEFSHIGLLIFATGAIYLMIIGRRLLPSRRTEEENAEDYKMGEYVAEVVIREGSSLIGRTVIEAELRGKYDTNVLDVYRGGQKLPPPIHRIRFEEGDTLFIETSSSRLLQLEQQVGLSLPPEKGDALKKGVWTGKERGLIEVVIGPTSDLIGGTAKSTSFRSHFNCTIIAIRHHGTVLRERLNSFRFHFGDTLLLRGTQEELDVVKREPGFIAVTAEIEKENFRTHKTPIALGIIGGVVLLAALGTPILVTAIVGAVLMVWTGCLRVNELHDAIRWDVIFLLAGIIPLGLALERTGGAALLANLATGSAEFLPPVMVLMVFYLVTVLLAEFISHSAAVVVMVPVGVATGVSLGFDPRAFVLACMFAASMSFSTPVGYQTNAMVYGPGGYKFLDFTRVGAPLSLLMSIMVPIYIYYFWGM